MKSLDKKKELSKCCNAPIEKLNDWGAEYMGCSKCFSAQSLDKNKLKELEWAEEFNKKFYSKIAFQEKYNSLNPNRLLIEVKNFIQQTLTKQRTELLEEIKTRIDNWGGFEDDGGNLCHYDSEILEWVNDLLNKKND